MPKRTYRLTSLITRFVLLSLAAVALAVLRPASRAGARVQEPRRRRSGARRIAVSLSFATLFFAGASFSAGAGDLVAGLVEQDATTAAQAVGDSECSNDESAGLAVQGVDEVQACSDDRAAAGTPGADETASPAPEEAAPAEEP